MQEPTASEVNYCLEEKSIQLQTGELLKLDLKAITAQEGILKLFDGDQYIGESIYQAGNLKIQINSPLKNLELSGSVNLHSLSINTPGTLRVKDTIQTKQVCAIQADNFIAEKNLVSQTVLSIHASGSIVLEGKAVSHDIDMVGDAITLRQRLHTETLNLNAKTSLNIEQDVNVKQAAYLQASEINNHKNLFGNRIIIESQQKVSNFGFIKSNKALKIRTPEFLDEGKLYSRHKINILANKGTITKEAEIHSECGTKLIINDLDHRGQLQAKQFAFLVVKTLQNFGEIKFQNCAFLSANKVNLQPNSKLGWFNDPSIATTHKDTENYRIIKIEDNIIVDSGSEFSLSQTRFTAQELNIMGSFDAHYSVIESDSMKVSGDARLTDSKISIAKALIADKKSKIKLKNSYVKTDAIISEPESKVKSKHSAIHTGLFKTAGTTKLKLSELKSKFTRQSGKSNFSQSQIITEKRFLQEKGADLTVSASQIEAASIGIDGKTTVSERTLLKADDVRVSGELQLKESGVKGKKYFAEKKSVTKSSRGSQWSMTDTMYFKGKSTFSESMITTERLSNEGDTRIKQSVVDANTLLHGKGKLKVDGTEIKSDSLHIDGQHEISRSKLETTLMDQSSRGIIKQTHMKAKFIDTGKGSHSEVISSKIETDFGQFEGDLIFKDTSMSADIVSHEEGQLKLTENTHLKVKTITNTNKSTLSLDTSVIGGKHADLEGKTDLTKAKLDFETIHASHLDAKKSEVKAKNYLNIQTSSHFSESQLQTGQLTVHGKMKIENKSVAKTKHTTVLSEGSVKVKESGLLAEKHCTSFGEFKLEKSQLSAEEIQIYNTFVLTQKSQAAAKRKISVKTTGQLKMSDSAGQARNISVDNSVHAKNSILKADHDIELKYGSSVYADGLSMQAGREIRVSAGSEIEGKSAALKAFSLENGGRICLRDNVHIDTEILSNNFGLIDGGKLTNIETNRCLTNFLGHIGGKNTNITATSVFNWLGDIAGNDHLTINSLGNLNLFGTYRSYNANINSLVEYNAGFIMPTIPSSLSAVFTFQRGLSFSRMLLTKAFPSMSHAINFGFQALPLAITTGKKIFDVATDPDKNWEYLLPDLIRRRKDWRNWKLKDVVPTILEIKGLAVSGYSLASSGWKACNEISNFSSGKIKEDLKSNINFKTILDTAGTVFGPSLSRESLFNFNMGIAASLNVTQTDFASLNNGIQFGAQSLTHSAKFANNNGIYAGNGVTMTGRGLVNSGILVNHENMYIDFNNINFTEFSRVYANHGRILGDKIQQHGKLNLNSSILRAQESFTLGKTGSLSMKQGKVEGFEVNLHGKAKTTVVDKNAEEYESSIIAHNGLTSDGVLDLDKTFVKGRTVSLDGETEANSSYIQAKQSFVLGKTGTLGMQKSHVEGDTVDIHGKAKTTMVDQNAEAYESSITAHNGLTSDGMLDLNMTLVKGKTVSLDGETKTYSSRLEAKEDFVLGKAGTLDMKKSEVEGDTVDLHGGVKTTVVDQNAEAYESSITARQNLTSDGKFDIAGTHVKGKNITLGDDATAKQSYLQAENGEFKITKSGRLEMQETHIEAKSAEIDGTLQTTRKNPTTETHNQDSNQTEKSLPEYESTIQLEEDLTINKSGEVDLDLAHVKARSTKTEGTLKGKDSNMELEESFVVEQPGKMQTNNFVVTARNTELGGELHLTKTLISAREEVDITSNKMKVSDTSITGNKLNMAGTAEYSGYFGLTGNEKITTTTSSYIQSVNTSNNNLLELRGLCGDIQGGGNVDNASVKINYLDSANDFVAGKGAYAHFQVSEYLGLDTEVDLHLNQPISRSCGLDLNARSITFATDYHTQHNVSLRSKAGHVAIYNNLSGKNVYAEAKGGNLYTCRNTTASEQVVLIADGDYFNIGGKVTGDTILCKGQNVTNIHRNSQVFANLADWHSRGGSDGSFSGRQVFLEATNGNITNFGGVLSGSQYLQGIATNDIINQCNVSVTKGKYDTMKTFDPAVISGGTGLDEQGIGLYLSAGGKVRNIGSTIASQGHNYIFATQGVESTGLHHTYISERKKKEKWYGKKEKKTKTTTTVQSANIITTNGKNIITSEQGGLTGIATNFISTGGTQAFVRDDISLYDLRYTDKKTKKTENLWGISKSKKEEKHDGAVPVLILDNGITRLESAAGNIFARGVVVAGDGDFITKASQGSVKFSTSILSHDLHEKKKGLSVSIPSSKLFSQPDHLKNTLFSNFGFDKVQNLWNSNNTAELAANSWNTGVAGYNLHQNILSNFSNNNWSDALLQTSGIAEFFQPTFDIAYTSTDTKTHYETVGPGFIQRRSWQIEAGEEASIQGMDVDISGDMYVKAKLFDLKGHQLNSFMSYKEHGVNLGVSFSGEVLHAGAHYSEYNNKATHIHHQATHVGSNLHVDVDHWNLAGANVDAKTLTGEVRKELRMTSLQDAYREKMAAASFDTSGQFSFQTSEQKSKHISKTSGIHVRDGINHDTTHQFRVNTTINEGAKITTDGVNQFQTEVLINKEVHDRTKGHSFGVSGNIHHVLDAASTKPHSQEKNNQPSGPVHVMNIQVGEQHFSAVQQATYHGQQGTEISYQTCTGNLNSENSDGRVVSHDSHTHISLYIPLVDPRKLISKESPKNKQVIDAETPQSEWVKDNTEQVSASNNENQATTQATGNSIPTAQESNVENKAPQKTEEEKGVENEPKIDNDPTIFSEEQKTTDDSDNSTPEKQANSDWPTTLQNFAIEMGFTSLEIGYGELETFLEQQGEAGVSKIFKNLGMGVSFVRILIEEKASGNEEALKTAFIRTAVEMPLSLSWRIGVPLNLLAKATEPFTDGCDQDDKIFIRQEAWDKYGHDENFFAMNSELFVREDLAEAYGTAKALQFFANLPSTISKFVAHKITNNSTSDTFTDKCDQDEKAFIRQEAWDKYGHDQNFAAMNPELFEREDLSEAYGTAKALQFFANLPSMASEFVASKFTNNSASNVSPKSFTFFQPASAKVNEPKVNIQDSTENTLKN